MFDVGTLRNWEQGRELIGPAKSLLRAIQTDPEAVLKAFGRVNNRGRDGPRGAARRIFEET
jgi:hypothetical protein